MSPIKSTQSRTGGRLLRGGRTTDVTSDIDGSSSEISGRREDNLSTLLTVSGGTKIESGNDRYHVFTSPGTFTTGAQLTAEVLVVAGGGSGAGAAYGAGGGAGGVLHAPSTSIAKGRYDVTVSGQGYYGGWYNTGGDGDDSSFADAIAKGGGGACGYINGPADRRGPNAGTITTRGRAGGSSGGSGPQTGGSGSAEISDAVLPQPAPGDYTPYGNTGGSGGIGAPSGYQGGGGGGAGGVGTNAAPDGLGVAGGNGRAFPSFPAPVIQPGIPSPVRPAWTPVVGPTGLFAGGGSSGSYYTSGGAAGVTPGGGGAGAGPTTAPGGDGVRFTGSGGGGGNYPQYPLTGYGGKGAEGIVIVKYSVA
jgi:hypothetical protein